MPDAPPAHARLDTMLMFRLYQAWWQATPVFTRLCEGKFGITRREWRLLATAVEHGPLSSTALAQAAKLDAVRTSRAIGTLCDKRLLARRRDPCDGRRVHVIVTDSGHKLYDELMPALATLNRMLTSDLTDEEVATLHRLLPLIEARGRMMNAEGIVSERTDRHRGGTRRRRD